MKTPIQEHIKWLKERHKHFSSQWEMDIVAGLEYAINHAEQMLEKEKEQIMDAYMEGGDWEALPQPRFDNYYNQTFKTKER
jgi:hypothetical protein